MGLAWGVGYYLTKHLFEKNNLDPKPLALVSTGMFISAWVGAKVFFLLFSSQNKVSQYLYADAFWLGGGFVFYGGLIFGLLFYIFYSLYLKKFNFEYSKFFVPGLSIGHALGRVGCFLTGCCFGSQCDLPWAINMHGELRHPVQLYESLGLLIIGIMALNWLQKGKSNLFLITRYLALYGALRFFVEFFRGDIIRGVYFLNLSTSQIISLAMMAGALGVIVWERFNRRSSS